VPFPMSNQNFIDLVFARGPINHDARIILLAIATFADDAGAFTTSVAKLMDMSRMSQSATLRAVRRLANEGWITTQPESPDAREWTVQINLEKLEGRHV
jgi:DNA-binding MarR family transcriptional regulator